MTEPTDMNYQPPNGADEAYQITTSTADGDAADPDQQQAQGDARNDSVSEVAHGEQPPADEEGLQPIGDVAEAEPDGLHDAAGFVDLLLLILAAVLFAIGVATGDTMIAVLQTLGVLFSRSFAMHNRETFRIRPIRELLHRNLLHRNSVVDPFARNSTFGTCTNDPNAETAAMYHMDAVEFLDLMIKRRRKFWHALLDPPYSARQIQECYQIVGRKVTQRDTQFSPMLGAVKDRIHLLLKPKGTVICCGWNSGGMGLKRGYELIEQRNVYHGGMRHDTIVTVERRAE
jgi:hypothetical protein